MNASKAREQALAAKQNAKLSVTPRIYSCIQDRATNGKNFMLCRSNKATHQQLKRDGFRSILLGPINLIWW